MTPGGGAAGGPTVRAWQAPAAGLPALRHTAMRWLNTLRSPFLRPRRFHAFGVGMAKTGTHSLAAMFRAHYRCAHEPEEYALTRQILDRAAGRSSAAAVERYLVEADRRLKLELNVSLLNYFVLPSLLELFGEARFILTVRPPLEWLDSMINQQLGRPAPPHWRQLRDLRFEVAGGFPAAERALESRGLYPLEGYLGYWARHNREVVRGVPGDRLLVIETSRLGQSADRLAAFLGVPEVSLDTRGLHAFAAVRRYGVLSQIDPAYLGETAERLCGDVARLCGVGLGTLSPVEQAAHA